MTLVEFLLARIAEDEAMAQRCISRNQFGDVTSWHPYRHQVATARLPMGSVAVPAPGFLAECEAKRAIVALYEESTRILAGADGDAQKTAARQGVIVAELAMQSLATIYADHPDFDGAWLP